MIGDIIPCIRSCCDDADDESNHLQLQQRTFSRPSSYDPPQPSSMSRSIRGTRVANVDMPSDSTTATETVEFQAAEAPTDDESSDGETNCCRPEPPQSSTAVVRRHVANNSRRSRRRKMFWFWRQASYEEVDQHEVDSPSFQSLKAASTFSTTNDVPSISTEEIVMPGSELQTKMAQKMAETLEEQGDECVICMETFSAENPRMPTICGCGENKTYFHLPCLYQWIDQSQHCPSCRKELVWEEF